MKDSKMRTAPPSNMASVAICQSGHAHTHAHARAHTHAHARISRHIILRQCFKIKNTEVAIFRTAAIKKIMVQFLNHISEIHWIWIAFQPGQAIKGWWNGGKQYLFSIISDPSTHEHTHAHTSIHTNTHTSIHTNTHTHIYNDSIDI